MAKGKEIIQVTPEQREKIEDILAGPGTRSQKRREILYLTGLRTRRAPKVALTEEVRKALRKKKAQERRKKNKTIFAQFGIAPQKRVKLSRAQKEQRAREGRQKRYERKKDFLFEAVQQNPDLAKRYGIDINRFKPKNIPGLPDL